MRDYPSRDGLDAVQPSALRAFHIMVKPIGPLCNLDCSYCFYLRKEALYPQHRGPEWRMSEATLETFIRAYIEAQQVPEVNFAWQGGEPTLLGLPFFERVVALQRKYRPKGMVLNNALQTNGTLLDEDWCRFLRENRFLVGLSLDGPPDLHDQFRVDKGGRPTSAKVLAALRLMQREKVDFNILCVVNSANQREPERVYGWLREQGARFMQFIPATERSAGGGLAPWSCDGAGYGEFMCGVFDQWVRADVGRVFVQAFDVSLRAWCGLDPGLCVNSATCGEALALEHNGDLYSCDHFVQPYNALGNISRQPLAELVSQPFQRKFGSDKRDALPEQCRVCPVLFVCGGGCPKERWLTTAAGQDGLSVLCEGYLRFYQHIAAPMRYMASEVKAGRPAAGVMRWLAARERRL